MVGPQLASPQGGVTIPSDKSAAATFGVADYDAAGPIRAEHLARVSAPLSSVLTLELDGAQQSLGVGADEILLAALGRAIARAIGDGVVPVAIAQAGRSTASAVALPCTTVQQASATETLSDVHRSLAAVRRHNFGDGLVQYLNAPSEVCFNYLGAVAEPPVGETGSADRHILALWVYRAAGVTYLDWWYDTRRFHQNTVADLAAQFPLALIELTSEAVAPI